MKVAQSCLTLCNPMDYTVCGILQARTLEWVALPFSRGSSQPWDPTQVSRIAGGFFTSWVTSEAPKHADEWVHTVHGILYSSWNSPGWNTGVGSHSLLQGIFLTQRWNLGFPSESESCSVVSDSLQPLELYSLWNSPGQNTGVGSLSLLQGIFPFQGSNPGLLQIMPL